MKCPKCQTDNPEIAKFCIECAYDLRQAQGPISDVYSHPRSYTPKHLTEKSKYKELNGIKAEAYLEMARKMFEEMDLQWDLDELDRIVSYR